METLVEKLKSIARKFPNGFTVTLPECDFVKSGWVIALKETQNSFGDEGLKKVIEVATKTTHIMGGWKDGKLYFWDAVFITHDENEAIEAGKANEQIAIYNLDEQKVKFL